MWLFELYQMKSGVEPRAEMLDSWIPGHQPVLEDVVVGLEEDNGRRLSDVVDEGVGLLHVDGEAVDQKALRTKQNKYLDIVTRLKILSNMGVKLKKSSLPKCSSWKPLPRPTHSVVINIENLRKIGEQHLP